jgi:MFS family permease
LNDGVPKRLEPVKRVGYLELIRGNRNFRQIWLGQVVSQMGDWFNTIALYSIVLTLTGSGRAVGLVLVARFLPTVFAGPFAGVIADRYSRRTIMIVSDLLRAVIVLGFLFIHRPDQVWLIYVLTVTQLVFSSFFEPARSAAIPSIVEKRELVTANAIGAVTWSSMLTLGAAIGGVITGAFGTNVAFVLDSVTYLVSAVLIATVVVPKRPRRPKSKLTIAKALGITDTFEGVNYVLKRPRVFALLLVKSAWGLGGGILALLAVFGEKIFPVGGSGATGIGVLYAARGIGTAIGPILSRRFAGESQQSMQTAIGISFLLGGVFYILFGVSTNFALALVMLVIAHAGGSTLWVNSTVLLQRVVEDNFRGRVFAADFALLTLTMAVSNYATGEMLDRFGFSPRAVTVGIGVLFLLPAALWFLTQRWWNDIEKHTD